MKQLQIILYFFCVNFLFAQIPPPPPPPPPPPRENISPSEAALLQEIRSVFNQYHEALLQKDGYTATATLSKQTLDFYKNVMNLAIYADKKTLEKASLLKRIMVLVSRVSIPKKEFLALSEKEYIAYAISEGMIGNNEQITNIRMGKIEIINENKATGQIIVKGETIPFSYIFYKENNVWKLDLSTLFSLAEIGFKQAILKSGESENDIILALLYELLGKKPSKSIWKPLKKQKK